MSEDQTRASHIEKVGPVPLIFDSQIEETGVTHIGEPQILDEAIKQAPVINGQPSMKPAGELTPHHTEPEGTVQLVDKDNKHKPSRRRDIYNGYTNAFTRMLHAFSPTDNQGVDQMAHKQQERKEALAHAAA